VLYDLVSRGLLSDVALRGALDRCAPVEAVQPQAEATPLEAAAEEVAEAASTADAAAPGEPEPRAEKKQREGLSEIDATTRGLGGGRVVSCGEENLLDIAADPWFRDESVLCHELGHTVMNIGLSEEARELIRAAHADAIGRGLYPSHCYMGCNADEYWAEGTQAWFDATCRTDVTAGVNARARLAAHDPALALLLRHAYGNGAWRFTQGVGEATREKWRSKQLGAAAAVAGAVAGNGSALPPPPRAMDPADTEAEDQMMAIAIAQSLEGMSQT